MPPKPRLIPCYPIWIIEQPLEKPSAQQLPYNALNTIAVSTLVHAVDLNRLELKPPPPKIERDIFEIGQKPLLRPLYHKTRDRGYWVEATLRPPNPKSKNHGDQGESAPRPLNHQERV